MFARSPLLLRSRLALLLLVSTLLVAARER